MRTWLGPCLLVGTAVAVGLLLDDWALGLGLAIGLACASSALRGRKGR